MKVQSAEKCAAEILNLLEGGDGRLDGMPAGLEYSLGKIRELIVPKGYGGLAIHEASLDQVVATGAAQKFDDWQTALVEAGGVDGQVANNRIVVATAGVYIVHWHMGYEVSGSSAWVGHIYLDGVDSGIDWERNVAAAARPGSVSCSAPLTIPAGGIIEGYIEHNQGGDITCTKLASQLYVMRIG
jgi:hypothetical protein